MGSPEWGGLKGEPNVNYVGLTANTYDKVTIGFSATLPKSGRIIVKAMMAYLRSGTQPKTSIVFLGQNTSIPKMQTIDLEKLSPLGSEWVMATAVFQVEDFQIGECLFGIFNESDQNITIFLTHMTVDYLE